MHQRTPRLITTTIAAVFLVTGVVGAASLLPRELPSAEEIIADYLDAIGGAEAIRAH